MSRSQESQEQMMLDIGHSLQTPLSVLRTKIEKLRSSQEEIDLDAIEHSLMSLSEFIDDLLRLAQLENTVAHDHLERFSLSDLLEEIAEEVEIIARPHDITITRDIMPDIELCAEVNDLRCAIMNLASNAVKYMSPAGKREIAFLLAREDGGACLRIRDSGIGIGADDLPHIFDRFYRVNTSSEIRGSGLGLAISKKIFERHGGTLKAASVPGEGTEMIARLPLESKERRSA